MALASGNDTKLRAEYTDDVIHVTDFQGNLDPGYPAEVTNYLHQGNHWHP